MPGAKVCSLSDTLVIPVGIGISAAKMVMGNMPVTINKHKIIANTFDKIVFFLIRNLLLKKFILNTHR